MLQFVLLGANRPISLVAVDEAGFALRGNRSFRGERLLRTPYHISAISARGSPQSVQAFAVFDAATYPRASPRTLLFA